MPATNSSTNQSLTAFPTGLNFGKISPISDLDLVSDKSTRGDSKIVPALLSIAKSTRALVGIKLAALDFQNGQDELILALEDHTKISVSQIADTINVRPSTVFKMTDRLIEKGFIERVLDKKDARRTLVQLTPSGLDARSRLIAMREKLEAELLSECIDDPEVLRTLEFINSVLRTRLKRLR